MHDGTTPNELYEKARELWKPEDDPDNRSARYAQADERAANSEPPLHAAGYKRAANWVAALHRYEEFWRTNGRCARENTRNHASLPVEERRMGGWAGRQRRFEVKLCQYQILRLDVSPAFEWDPRERAWQEHLDRCIRHVQITGRLPYLNGADLTEYRSTRWLRRQLRRLRNGTLQEDRAVQISALLALAVASPS